MNRSLGGLRYNKSKNDDKQPDYLGRLLFTRDTLNSLINEMHSNPNDKIEVGLAGWNNKKRHKSGFVDSYLTVEVRTLSNKDKRFWKPTDDENPFTNLEQFFS